MIKPLYAIYDKLNGYLSPMVDVDDDNAIRNFDYACQNNGMIYFSPTDFSLYKIGEYNDESGEITPTIPPKFIINGIDHRKDEK